MSKIWLSETIAKRILGASERAYPLETGGILAGVSVENHPWITHSIEIRSKNRDESHYTPPKDSRSRAINRLRKLNPKLGYIGEWHTHHARVGPSYPDIQSIKGIGKDVGLRKLPVVLMLSMRTSAGYELGLWMLNKSALKRTTPIISGKLPN